MHRKAFAIVLLAGLAAMSAQGQQAGEKDAEATAAETAPPKPLLIPDSAKKMLNPVPPSEESVEHGLLLFSSQCAMCHGKSGGGDGDMAARLGVPVPDLTDPVKMKGRTDGELYWVLTEGHGKMPDNKERLRDESRWNLVNALRSLGAPGS